MPAATIAGDVEAGRQVFKKCQACHSLDPGKNMLGPSLAAIIGRRAGGEVGYDYSPAMKQANIVCIPRSWTYLTAPQKLVPGNKMPFPGLKTDHDRGDVIALLASTSGATPAATASSGDKRSADAHRVRRPLTAATSPPATASPEQPSRGGDIYIPDAKYTLRSGIAEGRMVFIGVGGDIDSKVNPVLSAAEGQVVQLTLVNGEGTT